MLSKIVVTVCTASHLAQAKALGDSLLKYNPGYKLIIGLADKLDGRVAPAYYQPHELIEASELSIPRFGEMVKQYSLLELSCALKYFFVDFAMKKYNSEKIIFLDSDILVFDSFGFLENELEQFSILVSPHIATPYPDDNKRPIEREMLKNGIFNAGFFAFKYDENGKAFLDWMKSRMIDQCYVDPKQALNADQSWFNFVPVYFHKVNIILHPGINVAYWNLHERKLSKQGEKYFVNDQPLIFFHYSGYSTGHPGEISKHQDRISFDASSTLKELFKLYHSVLINNGHERMLSLKCFYKKTGSNIFTKLTKKR
jgi:hypothetical protein